MREPAGGDVDVDALIAADLGVVLASVARIHRHRRGKLPQGLLEVILTASLPRLFFSPAA